MVEAVENTGGSAAGATAAKAPKTPEQETAPIGAAGGKVRPASRLPPAGCGPFRVNLDSRAMSWVTSADPLTEIADMAALPLCAKLRHSENLSRALTPRVHLK